jgi:hypothetical protein
MGKLGARSTQLKGARKSAKPHNNGGLKTVLNGFSNSNLTTPKDEKRSSPKKSKGK